MILKIARSMAMMRRLHLSLVFCPIAIVLGCYASGEPFKKKDTGSNGAIYVFRVFRFQGSGVSVRPFIDDQPLGDLSIGGYYIKTVPIGAHTASWGGAGHLILNVTPGSTCFLRVTLWQMEALGCEDEVPEELKNCKLQGSL